jgi:hypothetical protein
MKRVLQPLGRHYVAVQAGALAKYLHTFIASAGFQCWRLVAGEASRVEPVADPA